jgi:hypothetical protein
VFHHDVNVFIRTRYENIIHVECLKIVEIYYLTHLFISYSAGSNYDDLSDGTAHSFPEK